MTVLVAFDIEAVPDLEAGRRLLAHPDSTPDAEIRRMLGERYSRDDEDPTKTFLKVPIYRIVSIFVKALPVDSRGTGPTLVTFGGNGFDLPLLRYGAFALGVPVPGLHGGGHRNYWHRFGQDHVDLCDVLSGYGASAKPSLAEMAALAKIPVKIGGIDGGQVEAYVAAGRLTEVADYCMTDVLATYCVFLRYEMVRGDLTPAHLDASMSSLRATVQKHAERRPLLSEFLR